MLLWLMQEAARRQAATRGLAAADASISSRLPFFFAHPLEIPPADIFCHCDFRICFLSVCCCCSGAAAEVARAAQISMEDAAPARRGHLWRFARRLRQPDPCARVAQFSSVASSTQWITLRVQICCCSVHGRSKPRVESGSTQTRPVPSRSRYERAADGPLESGGAE